jgi:hypothetical protein
MVVALPPPRDSIITVVAGSGIGSYAYALGAETVCIGTYA